MLPLLIKIFNRDMLLHFVDLPYPVLSGNWEPKILNQVQLPSMLGVV